MVSINAINQVKEQYLSFSLLSYGARTRYSGANLSILLLYILTEQAHAKSGSDQNAECALSKLLQMGTVTEYQNESNPKTLDEAFSLDLAAEARFTDLQLLEFLRSYPLTLGEAFFRARITEAHCEDENNQAVDANVGDQEEPDVKDKQEVKKANDLEIKIIQDEEGKNAEDQQVSEADDDTNIDDFGCSLPHHKGADLTVEEVVLKNIKSDRRGRASKADGTWVPARRIEDGWHLFDELGSKLYFEYSIKNVHQLSEDKHADYNKKHKRGIRRVWDPGIKKKI
ncbi:hypothetical protein Tco_0969002 [Tanacetum coccineum]